MMLYNRQIKENSLFFWEHLNQKSVTILMVTFLLIIVIYQYFTYPKLSLVTFLLMVTNIRLQSDHVNWYQVSLLFSDSINCCQKSSIPLFLWWHGWIDSYSESTDEIRCKNTTSVININLYVFVFWGYLWIISVSFYDFHSFCNTP